MRRGPAWLRGRRDRRAGRAPDALLDTYPGERLPHVRAVIGLPIALGRPIFVADPDEAAERERLAG